MVRIVCNVHNDWHSVRHPEALQNVYCCERCVQSELSGMCYQLKTMSLVLIINNTVPRRRPLGSRSSQRTPWHNLYFQLQGSSDHFKNQQETASGKDFFCIICSPMSNHWLMLVMLLKYWQFYFLVVRKSICHYQKNIDGRNLDILKHFYHLPRPSCYI